CPLWAKSGHQSLDYSVGAGEQCRCQSKTEDLGSRQIDDKLEFSWLLDWKIARLYSAQNLIDIFGRIPKQLQIVWSVRHQSSRFDVFPGKGNRHQSRTER